MKRTQQVVLITGSSAGIGKATAQLLVESGAIVYGASRSGSEAYEHKGSGGKYIPVIMDVNNEIQIQSVIDQIKNDYGYLHTVIANAGNGIAGSVEDTSIEEIKYQFETNFYGVIKTIQACLPLFRQQGYGKILTVSSLAGIIPIPYQTFYSSVKAAIIMFMNALSMEVKPFGIQCCTILPGDTKTEFTNQRKYSKASQNPNSIYYQRLKKSVSRMEHDEQNGMSAIAVAYQIRNQALKRNMQHYCVTGFVNQCFYQLFNILPQKWRLYILSKLYA